MRWWHKHWRLTAIAGITCLAFVVIALLYIVRKKREAIKVFKEMQLLTEITIVEGLQAEKKSRSAELLQNDVAKKAIDAEIAEAKREAISLSKDVMCMSDIEIAVDYRKLGY